VNLRAKYVTLIVVASLAPLWADASAIQKGSSRDQALAVVRSFYQFHVAHNKDFTVRNIRQRKRWLTPELFGLLLAELKREAEESKAHRRP